MATRSAIGIKHGDIIKGVYCHWDGYLEHNGRILLEHYTDSVKINHLISLGDISTLSKEVGEQHPFSSIGVMDSDEYDTKYGNMTTFYGRDRGEEDTDFQTFSSEDAFVSRFDNAGAEYFYLYDHGVWYVNAYGRGWVSLHEALENVKELDNA